MFIFFTVKDGRLVVEYRDPQGRKTSQPIESVEGYWDFLEGVAEEIGVPLEGLEWYFSSSVDFPEEYTDDEEVIELCREIRGRGVYR
jgi:hypothetical protein